MVVVSKLTPGPTPEQINGYVYGTTKEMVVDERSESLIDEDNDDRVEMMPKNNNNNNNKNINDSSSVNDGNDDEFITTNLDKMTFEEVMTNMDDDNTNNGCCSRCMNLDGDESRFKKIVNIWTCITTIILLGLYIGYA